VSTTLTTLTTAVLAHLGVPSTDGVFTQTVVTGFINEALTEIATEHDWPWLQTAETLSTVAGTSYVTPAATWTGTRYVTITVGGVTLPLSRRTFDELLDSYTTTTPGRPEAWSIEQDRIELRPIPDSVYTITHGLLRAEKVLASGSDTPYMPDAYASAIVNLTVAIALGRSKEDSRAIAAQAHYDRWLGKMLDNRRRDRRPSRIRVRPGADI
jgi:hypothetical protein